jgi:two-component system response regulator BasR
LYNNIDHANMHLLIIEDDLELGAALQRALKGHGFTSEWVRNGKDALALSANPEQIFACALLDLGLPDKDGLDVLRQWRRLANTIPVILLTARDALQSRIDGLDAGADDYVIKPVAPAELASRIRAITRRLGGHSSSVWAVGRLEIDLRIYEVRIDGVVIDLSPMEFRIITELARYAGTVVAKQRIASAVQPLNEPIELNALEVHIHNLRRKLGSDSIRTVRGVGYSITT